MGRCEASDPVPVSLRVESGENGLDDDAEGTPKERVRVGCCAAERTACGEKGDTPGSTVGRNVEGANGETGDSASARWLGVSGTPNRVAGGEVSTECVGACVRRSA